MSWLQRPFGFSVPAVERINAQGEFNLHNILQKGYWTGDDGFDPFALPHSQNLFRVGFVGFFLIVPLLVSKGKGVRAFASRIGYVRPSNAFLLGIWSVVAVSVVLTITSPTTASATSN